MSSAARRPSSSFPAWGINAICGNPGDKVTVLDELSLAGAAAGSGQQGEFATSRGGMLARLRQSCTIAAVYPRD
ncbi:hypothetical protein GGR76_000594 [Xanthomonas translucens]|nr:hypothetical protein [Xanthomonas campestris]